MNEQQLLARANELWDGVTSIEPLPDCPGEWVINCLDRLHILAETGEPTCHNSCRSLAKYTDLEKE